MKISKVVIYDEPTVPQIHSDRLGIFLRNVFDVEAKVCDPFFPNVLTDISSCIINNTHRPLERQVSQLSTYSVPMYDGICLQQLFAKNIPQEYRQTDWLHVVFTDKLIGTYDYETLRYHARAIIGSNPAVISTTGIIEALAKPRMYYIAQMTKVPYDGWNGWLEYGDERLAYTARGYLMQALAYYVTGDAFCKDPKCVLYNAHWQHDLIKSQIESGTMCEKHDVSVRCMMRL
ncbi:MAG: hypothetical protein K8823_1458 [Cenarchaeum symbiont of Oopsacas minuta]|nr:hypothetical protein [Cenarchaeum symbiont of Oopsacas minuta]